MEFCCDKYGDLLDKVAALESAFDNMKDAYELVCAKLKVAEVERDAALMQMRENAEELERNEMLRRSGP